MCVLPERTQGRCVWGLDETGQLICFKVAGKCLVTDLLVHLAVLQRISSRRQRNTAELDKAAAG